MDEDTVGRELGRGCGSGWPCSAVERMNLSAGNLTALFPPAPVTASCHDGTCARTDLHTVPGECAPEEARPVTPNMALRRLQDLLATTDAPRAKLDEAEGYFKVLWDLVLLGGRS